MFLKNNRNEDGVISLEACIFLPIFILIVLFVYGFFIMFLGEEVVAHSMLQAAESLSLDSYANEKIGYDDVETGGDLVTLLYGSLMGYNDENFSSHQKWYNGSDKELMTKCVHDRFIGFFGGTAGGANELADFLNIENGAEGFDFSETTVDGEELTVKVKYRQSFMYNFNGLAAFNVEKSVKVHMWK